MRKLFDIRFSYKHCNFSRVCLLVKMASKTVTRSIALTVYIVHLQRTVLKYAKFESYCFYIIPDSLAYRSEKPYGVV